MGNSQSEPPKPPPKSKKYEVSEELKIVEDKEFLGAKVFIEKDSRV
jgi:hypothetical protein